MRYLIINADGYGFTEGITRAIEECIEFGTVKSISVNVNFEYAQGLPRLVQRYPHISVGCHVNPVVGRPVLDPSRIPSLIDEKGEFFYKRFSRLVLSGHMRIDELKAEMTAQIERTRELAGTAFSHADFHMGLHRLPGVYEAFLDILEKSGVRRIRTHRYLMGMESRFPQIRHAIHMLGSPTRIPKYCWNLLLRKKAILRGFTMPDRWVGITRMAEDPHGISVERYKRMLKNLPHGFNEFVAHPGYIDDDLKRWSTYHEQRIKERQILLSKEFKAAIHSADIHLIGYRELPVSV